MLRQQTFAILLLLSLTASYGMYIGGAPMVPQAGYPGPVQFGAGPFMGHHNALMMPHPDYDHPDIHPAMYHQPGFSGIPGMSFAGYPPPGALMPGQPGAAAQQVVHQPQPGALSSSSVVQSSVGGMRASVVQPQAGVPNPNMIQLRAAHGVAPQSQVNQVVAQSSGRVVNPSAGHQRASSAQHLTAAQSSSRVVTTGQRGASAAYPSVVQPRTITQTAVQPSHGAVSTGQVSAVRTTLIQPGTINQAPNAAGVRVVHPQPGAVATSFAAGPQPRIATAGVGGQLSRMPMGQYGAVPMGRRGPFPRDGTYRTAHGEYVRDGSDLSFDPRY